MYKFIGHYGYFSNIEFAEGENINRIVMGNSSAWDISPRGNKLLIKPINGRNPITNMLVETNQRSYYFELDAKNAEGIDDEDLILVAVFVYPDEEDKSLVRFNTTKVQEIDLNRLVEYNFDYEYVGAPNIAPTKIFDDGRFTFFEFADRNTEMPAIYVVDNQGFESIVNFRATEDYMIVERTASQFTLRSGSDIVCVYNNNQNIFSDIKEEKKKSKFKEIFENTPDVF